MGKPVSRQSRLKSDKSSPLGYDRCEPRNLLAATHGIENHFLLEQAFASEVQVDPSVEVAAINNHIASGADTAYLLEGASGLVHVTTQTEAGQTTTVLQQTLNGLPIHNAFVTVTQNESGEIEGVFDRGHQNLRTYTFNGASIDADQAEDLAAGQIAKTLDSVDSVAEPVWFFTGNRARLAWHVDSVSSQGEFETIIDAYSSNVLEHGNASEFLNSVIASPELEEGVYPRIVINDTIGAQGSRDYAADFDSVAALALGCTGTLIAPNVVLSARHCGASAGDQILFGDDSDNADYVATVQSVELPDGNGSLLDGGDVAILTLTQNVPSNIATPMRLIDATDSLEGMVAATIGYGFNGVGSQGHGFSSDGIRWGGENIIDVYGSPANSSGSNIISTDFDDGTAGSNTISGSDPNPIQFEATTAPGDSGGPILVQVNGEWVIAGVLSGGTTNTSVYGDVSWWTGTAIYRTQIENAGGVFIGSGLGTVSLDKDAYFDGDTAFISVVDDNAVDPISVTLTSDRGDSETITLSGAGSTYTGSITIDDASTSSGDGVLQVAVGDVITVTYVDPDDGDGNSNTVTDTATIIELSSGTLAGLDFGEPGDSTPGNWQLVTEGSNTTFTDIGDENGGTTGIDLSIVETVDGSWSDFAVTPDASTIPVHANDLANIGGQIYTDADSLVLTYSDLTPGRNYEIYVMAAEGFYASIEQTVTITGGDGPVSFEQRFDQNQLFINDQLGDSTRSLSEYAQVISADNNGEIVINIDAIAGSSDVVLAGLAIMEIDETPLEVIGEAGLVPGVNHNWTTVNLQNTYENPVVIVSPSTFNGVDPVTIRAEVLSGNSFRVQIYEYNYLNGTHIAEDLSFVVFESGTHELENGLVLEAGVTTSDQNVTWNNQSFTNAFDAPPLVFSQMGSSNGGDAVTLRHQNVSTTGFEYYLQEEERNNQFHFNETIHWLAIESGLGTTNGALFESSLTANQVGDADESFNFQQTYSSTPAFIASMQGFLGFNPANTRLKAIDQNGFTVFVEEEKSLDSEIRHLPEDIGYFAIAPGDIYGLGSQNSPGSGRSGNGQNNSFAGQNSADVADPGNSNKFGDKYDSRFANVMLDLYDDLDDEDEIKSKSVDSLLQCLDC